MQIALAGWPKQALPRSLNTQFFGISSFAVVMDVLIVLSRVLFPTLFCNSFLRLLSAIPFRNSFLQLLLATPFSDFLQLLLGTPFCISWLQLLVAALVRISSAALQFAVSF